MLNVIQEIQLFVRSVKLIIISMKTKTLARRCIMDAMFQIVLRVLMTHKFVLFVLKDFIQFLSMVLGPIANNLLVHIYRILTLNKYFIILLLTVKFLGS